jgi:hypothetical protein
MKSERYILFLFFRFLSFFARRGGEDGQESLDIFRQVFEKKPKSLERNFDRD